MRKYTLELRVAILVKNRNKSYFHVCDLSLKTKTVFPFLRETPKPNRHAWDHFGFEFDTKQELTPQRMHHRSGAHLLAAKTAFCIDRCRGTLTHKCTVQLALYTGLRPSGSCPGADMPTGSGARLASAEKVSIRKYRNVRDTPPLGCIRKVQKEIKKMNTDSG